MSIHELAHRFAAAAHANDLATIKTMWAEDVVAIEAPGDDIPGEMQVTRGHAAIEAKHAWWEANFTVHGGTTDGPFINGKQFALVFNFDATDLDGQRVTMREVALYTTRDGKVVEERFFPEAPRPA